MTDSSRTAAGSHDWEADTPMLACRYVLFCFAFIHLTQSPFAARANEGSASEVSWIGERLYQEGIGGTLVICGGGAIADEAKQRFVKSLGPEGKVVVLPAASADPTTAVDRTKNWLAGLGIHEVSAPPPGSVDQEHLAQMCEWIRAAGGIWICGGQQSRIAEAYLGTEVERAIVELLERGGVVGGTSAGAAIMSRHMIASGRDEPEMGIGFDLVPDGVIDQHFTERGRIKRLRTAIARHPYRFGLGIDEGTAVIIRGRTIDVVGQGSVTVVLAQAKEKNADGDDVPFLDEIVQAMPSQSRADLTQLRRAARWRAAGVNPGKPVGAVRSIPHGSLVIVGGGGMPKAVIDRFVALAGGPAARIVVLPTAVPRAEAFRQQPPRFLTAAGVQSVTVLPQSRTDEVHSDAFRQALRDATGVWFDGGRQWNFVDAYENTEAVELFHDVLRRGGVIGGSSAGATIQGEYLVRGHPLGNQVMMAEGYERGFAFLPGVAIDQHFSQRNRFPDLIPVVRRHPGLLGIGIDEATALVVTPDRAEVIGRGEVHLITAEQVASGDDSENGENPQTYYRSFPTGQSIDLINLEILKD